MQENFNILNLVQNGKLLMSSKFKGKKRNIVRDYKQQQKQASWYKTEEKIEDKVMNEYLDKSIKDLENISPLNSLIQEELRKEQKEQEKFIYEQTFFNPPGGSVFNSKHGPQKFRIIDEIPDQDNHEEPDKKEEIDDKITSFMDSVKLNPFHKDLCWKFFKNIFKNGLSENKIIDSIKDLLISNKISIETLKTRMCYLLAYLKTLGISTENIKRWHTSLKHYQISEPTREDFRLLFEKKFKLALNTKFKQHFKAMLALELYYSLPYDIDIITRLKWSDLDERILEDGETMYVLSIDSFKKVEKHDHIVCKNTYVSIINLHYLIYHHNGSKDGWLLAGFTESGFTKLLKREFDYPNLIKSIKKLKKRRANEKVNNSHLAEVEDTDMIFDIGQECCLN